MKSDEDLRAGCDAIQGDMAKHQRMFKSEVTPDANQKLAAETFEQLEKQWAEDDANPWRNKPAEAAPAPIERTESVHEIDGRRYRLVKEQDDTKFRRADEAEQWFIAHAMPRLDLLLTKHELGSAGDGFAPVLLHPVVVEGRIVGGEIASSSVPYSVLSWSERVKAVLSWKHAELAFPHMYMQELVLLLEHSNRHFGDWKADAPSKVIIGG